jgi:DNA-binding CsgD family transcriptional regulator
MALRTADRLSRLFPNGTVEREEMEGDALEALVRADNAWNSLPPKRREGYADRVVFLRIYVRRRIVDALRSREGRQLKKLRGRAAGLQWDKVLDDSTLTLAEVVADPTQDTETQAIARVRMGTERPPRRRSPRCRKKRDMVTRHGGSPLGAGELETLADAAVGLTTQESAKLRRKSLETVKTQRRQAMAKLFARNTTHAVHLAHVQGLL